MMSLYREKKRANLTAVSSLQREGSVCFSSMGPEMVCCSLGK